MYMREALANRIKSVNKKIRESKLSHSVERKRDFSFIPSCVFAKMPEILVHDFPDALVRDSKSGGNFPQVRSVESALDDIVISCGDFRTKFFHKISVVEGSDIFVD